MQKSFENNNAAVTISQAKQETEPFINKNRNLASDNDQTIKNKLINLQSNDLNVIKNKLNDKATSFFSIWCWCCCGLSSSEKALLKNINEYQQIAEDLSVNSTPDPTNLLAASDCLLAIKIRVSDNKLFSDKDGVENLKAIQTLKAAAGEVISNRLESTDNTQMSLDLINSNPSLFSTSKQKENREDLHNHEEVKLQHLSLN